MTRSQGAHPPAEPDFAAHDAELRRFAARRLGPGPAEEVVQEAFAAAYAAFADGRERPADTRAWLFAVLRRKIVDRIRRDAADGRAMEEVRHLLAEPTGRFDGGSFVARPNAWGVDPQQAALANEFWDKFDACVDRLPLRMRQAFILREIDDVSTAGVAELLGVSVNNVWTLIHRARLRLRDDLGEFLK